MKDNKQKNSQKSNQNKINQPNKNKQKKQKRIRPSKNVSQTIRNGTVVYTRDEYFEDNNDYRKTEYMGNNKLYRDVIVVDSNRNDELGVIKIQSGGKEKVKNKSGQTESYSPYIKTKDNEGQPIKIGTKFQVGDEKYSVFEQDANEMKKKALGKDKQSRKIQRHKKLSPKQEQIKQKQIKTRQELQQLKGRKKKSH